MTRGDLYVGQMFSRHLCPLYPHTGTQASACLSTPNPAVSFQAKMTTTVPNCLEGSCDAGHPTVVGSRGHRVRALMKYIGAMWNKFSSRKKKFFTFYDVAVAAHLCLLWFNTWGHPLRLLCRNLWPLFLIIYLVIFAVPGYHAVSLISIVHCFFCFLS